MTLTLVHEPAGSIIVVEAVFLLIFTYRLDDLPSILTCTVQ
jgi:hypothetical protein